MRLPLFLALLITLITPAPLPAQEPGAACLSAMRQVATAANEDVIRAYETCLDAGGLEAEQEVVLYAGLGAAYLTDARYREALTALNMAFAIADTQEARIIDPSTWRNRGIARAQLGLHEGALEDLHTAGAAMPDDVLTHLNLGILYQDLDRPADAVVAYDHVVRLEPEWTGAWINRSSALLDVGLTDAAVKDARRAVELAPTDGTTLNMLCWTLIQDDKASLALPLCEQAVAAEPDIGAIVHSHATALKALGRLDEAIPLYRRARDLAPEDPEISADYERTCNP